MPFESYSRTADTEGQLQALIAMMAEIKAGQDKLKTDIKAVQEVMKEKRCRKTSRLDKAT